MVAKERHTNRGRKLKTFIDILKNYDGDEKE